MNAAIKRICTDKRRTVHGITTASWMMQCRFLFDIRRGLQNKGDYKPRSGGESTFKVLLPDVQQDANIEVSLVPDLLLEGKVHVSHKSSPTNLTPSKSITDINLAKYFVKMNQVTFVQESKTFVVKGLCDTSFMVCKMFIVHKHILHASSNMTCFFRQVDLKSFACTCKKVRKCSHIYAVLLTVGKF